MPEDRNALPQQAAMAPASGTNRPGSRRLLRRGVVVTVIVVLLGLVIFHAPRYVARHLVASQLDQLGIEYEGVDTLSINPFKGELWMGPVRFGAGAADRGQFGELGLNLRLKPLWQRRVSIERLRMRGIDLIVTRSQDGSLALNGIALEQLRPRPDTTLPPADPGDAWEAGVDTLELRESRLIFRDRDRGELELDVERLTLTDFQTWQEERPGRFELAARLNDIALDWSGEARYFADNITLSVDSRTQQADVTKVVRFTGPWGLDRQDGTYDADIRYEMTLFDSGRLEGQAAGTIEIQGADYERAGEFALALERLKIDLDVEYTLSESGDFALQGQMATDLGPGRAGLGEDTRFAAQAGRFNLRGLDAAYASDGTVDVKLRPEVALEGVGFSGPIEISVGKLLELLAYLQSLSAPGEVSTADTGLGDYADTVATVPSSDVKVGRLEGRDASFSFRSSGGQVELGLNAETDLFDIRIGVGETSLQIGSLQSELARLSVTSGGGRLTLETAGNNALVQGIGKGSRSEFRLGALEANVNSLGLEVQSGEVALQLSAASNTSGFSGLIYATRELPEVALVVGAANAALGEASLESTDGRLRWAAAGDAAVDALTAEFAQADRGAIQFNRVEAEALQANERLELAADALSVDGLDLYFRRSLLVALLGDEGSTGAKAAAKTPVSRAAVQSGDVSRAQTLLTELGYAPGAVDGLMGPRTAAAIRDFQRREGLRVDGRLSGDLLSALEARIAGSARRDAAPARPAAGAGPVPGSLRVGLLSLTGKPVIRFRDDIVTPQVNIDTVFNEAQVRNLDTRKTEQRTDLSLVADVNEFTHVELSGWINGFSESADLDLKAKVENLELSTYSPYVVELSGVYLDSGQLDTTTVGRAAQGSLQGEIQLELDDIAFRPLSEKDAERVAGKVGVPLKTAVDLLQDDKGRIALTLPLGGTLGDPQVEIAPAVNKAIAGALKKVFPPTMIASLLSGVAKGGKAAFEPIVFAPGSAELDEAGRGYANELVEFLVEHPKLSLKVCGRSTAQDMENLVAAGGAAAPPAPGKSAPDKPEPESVRTSESAQVLEELAIERSRTVRRYLINERGGDAKRIPECRSTFEPEDQGRPRVEIAL